MAEPRPLPRALQLLVFLTLVTGIYGGAHLYVYSRAVAAFAPAGAALWAARAAAVALALSFPLARLVGAAVPCRCTAALDWAASAWMGVFLYMLLGTAAVHAGSALLGVAFAREAGAAAAAGPLRWAELAVFAAALGLAGFGVREARHPRVTEVDIPMAKLPPELDGFTVAHLSDVHIGVIVGPRRLRRIVDRVNALAPDLVVITGDLVDEDASHLEGLAGELARLAPRHGVLAVTGNHEFYAGAEAVVRHATGAGVRWLRNERTVVAGRLLVYGVDDFAAAMVGRPVPPLEAVVDAEARQKPAILLQHRPVGLERAAALGIDLMLSGHVHRGQLWPLAHLARLAFPRDAGLFRVGATSLYVSRGVGTWGPPMRIASPPEIVRLRLRRA